MTRNGSYVDGVRVSEVNLSQLKLGIGGTIPVRLGVKDNARNIGGLNLFGSRFGNYPQDLMLKQRFQRGEAQNRSAALDSNGKEMLASDTH